MAGTEVELRGFKELAKLLEDLPYQLQGKALQAGVREGSQLLKEEAKRHVYTGSGLHRKSGFLKESIKIRKGLGTLTSVQHFTYVDNKAYYGYFWEKGFMKWSRGQNRRNAAGKVKGRKKGKKLRMEPARPFMRPAFDNSRDRILQLVAKKVKAVAEKQRSKVV